MALARYFDEQPAERMQSLLVYLPPLLLIAVPFLLIIKQPDLGTALGAAVGFTVRAFAAGMPWRFIFVVVVLGLGSLPVLWVQLHAYQKERVMTFLNPGADALGAGYQITQSKIALGSGGMFGKGFLMGSQEPVELPAGETD